MTDIIDRLIRKRKCQSSSDVCAAYFKEWDEPVNPDGDEARAEIIRLREKCDKQALILQHTYPERSGRYFISGQGGEVDRNGLPETVSICLAYGCDWTVTYRRVD